MGNYAKRVFGKNEWVSIKLSKKVHRTGTCTRKRTKTIQRKIVRKLVESVMNPSRSDVPTSTVLHCTMATHNCDHIRFRDSYCTSWKAGPDTERAFPLKSSCLCSPIPPPFLLLLLLFFHLSSISLRTVRICRRSISHVNWFAFVIFLLEA